MYICISVANLSQAMLVHANLAQANCLKGQGGGPCHHFTRDMATSAAEASTSTSCSTKRNMFLQRAVAINHAGLKSSDRKACLRRAVECFESKEGDADTNASTCNTKPTTRTDQLLFDAGEAMGRHGNATFPRSSISCVCVDSKVQKLQRGSPSSRQLDNSSPILIHDSSKI